MIEYPRTTKERIGHAATGITTAAVGLYSLIIGSYALADGIETVSSSSRSAINSQRWAVEKVVPFGLAEDIVTAQDTRSYRTGIDMGITFGGFIVGLPLMFLGSLHAWDARRKPD